MTKKTVIFDPVKLVFVVAIRNRKNKPDGQAPVDAHTIRLGSSVAFAPLLLADAAPPTPDRRSVGAAGAIAEVRSKQANLQGRYARLTGSVAS